MHLAVLGAWLKQIADYKKKAHHRLLVFFSKERKGLPFFAPTSLRSRFIYSVTRRVYTLYKQIYKKGGLGLGGVNFRQRNLKTFLEKT